MTLEQFNFSMAEGALLMTTQGCEVSTKSNSKAHGRCGAGLQCSGGGGMCGAGLQCGGGGGMCGSGLQCSGGGGRCGAGLQCGGE